MIRYQRFLDRALLISIGFCFALNGWTWWKFGSLSPIAWFCLGFNACLLYTCFLQKHYAKLLDLQRKAQEDLLYIMGQTQDMNSHLLYQLRKQGSVKDN